MKSIYFNNENLKGNIIFNYKKFAFRLCFLEIPNNGGKIELYLEQLIYYSKHRSAVFFMAFKLKRIGLKVM